MGLQEQTCFASHDNASGMCVPPMIGATLMHCIMQFASIRLGLGVVSHLWRPQNACGCATGNHDAPISTEWVIVHCTIGALTEHLVVAFKSH